MKKSIVITEDDKRAAISFANINAKDHKNKGTQNRSIDKKIENVFIGKLGEIAFSKLFDPPLEVDFSKGADPGWDFEINGNKIDIKTIDEYWKKRVYINKNYMNADNYITMFYNKKSQKFIYDGIISRSNAVNNLKYDTKNKTYFIPRDAFEK